MNSNGFFNYMSKNSLNSLFRNGKVLTKRDINGSDAGSLGINLEKKKMQVLNARNLIGNKKISIDKNGFEMIPYNINHLNLDFFNNKEVLDKYYINCADFIKIIPFMIFIMFSKIIFSYSICIMNFKNY